MRFISKTFFGGLVTIGLTLPMSAEDMLRVALSAAMSAEDVDSRTTSGSRR